MTFAWTPQQEAIFNAVTRGTGNLVIRALAGTGKSSTLLESILRLRKAKPTSRILYVAFNVNVVEEFKPKVGGACDVMTTNGLGHRLLCTGLGRSLAVGPRAFEAVRALVGHYDRERGEFVRGPVWRGSVERVDGTWTTPADGATVRALVRLAEHARNWLASEPSEVEAIAYRMNMDEMLEPYTLTEAAAIVWSALSASDSSTEYLSQIDYTDQLWLPWFLGVKPSFRYDYVFGDEAQDWNPAQFDLVRRVTGRRMILAADENQCHPPGVLVRTTSGDIPIEQLDPKRHGILSWSRHGQEVYNEPRKFKIARHRHVGPLVQVRASRLALPSTPEHRFICRWTQPKPRVFVTYLMYRKDRGYRVGWCQLFGGSGWLHLGQRARLEKAEKTWILDVFDSKTKASVYESLIAAKYGIPTMTFEPHGTKHWTRETIVKFFKLLETEVSGERCLVDHGRDPQLPFYPWPGKHVRDRQGRPTLFHCYAANLLPNLMSIPLPDTAAWTPITGVVRTDYDGPVYSLEVEKDHSYVANGLVTLNCLYEWRGADPTATTQMQKQLKAKSLPLTVTFRCPRRVVELASRIVPDYQAMDGAKDGTVRSVGVGTMLANLQPGDVVLSRSNASIVALCMKLLRDRIPAFVRGRDVGGELASLIRRSRKRDLPALTDWLASWRSREVAKLMDRGADDLAIEWVEDKYAACLAMMEGQGSVESTLSDIERLFSDDADRKRITLSTVHRFKGQEAERVWLLRWTFLRRRKGESQPSDEERRIWYVGVSRSKSELYLVEGGNDEG